MKETKIVAWAVPGNSKEKLEEAMPFQVSLQNTETQKSYTVIFEKNQIPKVTEN